MATKSTPQNTINIQAAAQKAAEEVAAQKAAEEAAAQKATENSQVFDKSKATFEAIAKEYSAHYPNCTEFHITSDRQVFLDIDLAAAKSHSRELKDSQVRTVKIK